MKHFRKDLYEEGEYTYPAAYGFIPNLHTYFHDDDQDRPCVLVVPGGGYCMVVPHEGEVVALDFYRRGMNAAVLTYTSDITMSVPLKDQPLQDAARAMRILRKHAAEYHIREDQIVICGFSAGGHVCATVSTHYGDVQELNPAYASVSARPDGTILCYPVITSGEYTHIYSMQALLGKEPTQEELDYYSLEKQVDENTPPAFIWQTVMDDLVPVENSYLYAEALRKHGVGFAHYAFPLGGHGMSVASKELWTADHMNDYSMEQVHRAVDAVKEGRGLNVSEERRVELMVQFFGENWKEVIAQDAQQKQDAAKEYIREEEPVVETNENPDKENFVSPHPDVSTWPYLAEVWLRKVIMKED